MYPFILWINDLIYNSPDLFFSTLSTNYSTIESREEASAAFNFWIFRKILENSGFYYIRSSSTDINDLK
jgi:hypothetical protein